MQKGILWFRNDLRLHDNESLKKIFKAVDLIVPVYIFDIRKFDGQLPGELPKMNRHRIQFIIDGVQALRNGLKERGGDLIVRIGLPEEILFEMAQKLGTNGVYCNRERMPEDVAVQDAVEQQLWTIGQELFYSRGKMLFHTSDLPFPVARTPDLFSTFLKETEHFVPIREPIHSADLDLHFGINDLDPGNIPELEDFGYALSKNNSRIRGGESAAITHMEKSIELIANGETDRLQISPWLASGNISPKFIYHTLEKERRIGNKIKKGLYRKLILRDYYRMISKRNPDALFRASGFKGTNQNLGQYNSGLLEKWIKGETGHDYVDACMRSLFETGYLGHGQRKIVARFLTDQWKVHWQLGAAYFESTLLDYEPCLNYGNWQRIAGISPDQKGIHPVNFDLIGQQMDPDMSFRKQWADYVVPTDVVA